MIQDLVEEHQGNVQLLLVEHLQTGLHIVPQFLLLNWHIVLGRERGCGTGVRKAFADDLYSLNRYPLSLSLGSTLEIYYSGRVVYFQLIVKVGIRGLFKAVITQAGNGVVDYI